jgi:hypothetical protein
MEVNGQLHTPAALPQGKNLRHPLGRRLGGPQSRSGHGVKEKNSQPPPGIEPRSLILKMTISIMMIIMVMQPEKMMKMSVVTIMLKMKKAILFTDKSGVTNVNDKLTVR